MKAFPRIGSIEPVSFPGEGIKGVSAKVDTGADSSAIWATDIVEQDGKLSFVLFGKASPFYSGRPIVTDNYRVVTIKNSFGQSEHRYKVQLKLALGGRLIRATFTLANREHNRYPVLIGRRTLHGKFLVDVTRKPSRQHKVLMISTKKTAVTEKFARNVERHAKSLEVTYISYDDLRFSINQPANSVTLLDDGRDIASFDLVHFKTTSRYADVAAATASYLRLRSVPFIDQAIRNYPGTSKLYQYILLEQGNLTVPRSVFVMPSRLESSFQDFSGELGLPFVLKDIHGNKGEHNYLVRDEASFQAACRKAAEHGVQCVAQAYIDNDGDYRVLIYGARIALVIQRSRKDNNTHLNNTSRGAQATLVPVADLPPALQTACIGVAKLLERQVSGVDIIRDKGTGVWYCLEVNDGPQLASGSFTEEKQAAFAAYLERKLNA